MANEPSQELQIPAEIRAFIEGIIYDSGMTDIEGSLKEEMIKEIFVRLDKFLTSVIVTTLPVESADEFLTMNEEKRSMEEIQKFMADKIPNIQEVFIKAFADFRNMYLGNVVEARERNQS